MTTYLTINAAHVVHDTIDGETLAIHSVTGCYHTITGLGERVWAGLVDGLAVDQISTAVAAHFALDYNTVETDIRALFDHLEAQELIVPLDTPPTQAGSLDLTPLSVYARPVVETFSEMQDLILLDPIHDVDDSGWPQLPAQ